MKTKAISSIFVLFAIAAGMASMAPAAFADHPEVTITPITGSGDPNSGCELDGCYNPSPVTVYVGSVIIFSNTDNVSHTFSSGVPADDIIGTEFNTGILAPGDSGEWIPENVGEFSYFDMIHPWMQGLIIVQESKGQTHSEKVVEETIVEKVVEETIVEKVVEETIVEKVVEETIVEKVVEETIVEKVVEETIVEKVVSNQESEEGGGCLIATATYGSEMSTEVQQLRELRDNQLLNTASGTQFMITFNDIYYSFSPIVADYERENPLFKEIVKIAITPMISTLSLMENANSESEVLGMGLSVIMLNLGMYLGVPAVVIIGIRKRI
jgi:plastocyanin